MTTQNRITLKNIKYAAFASQETPCYQATVYFDGKKAGVAANEGYGGCDSFDVTDKDVTREMMAFIDTLPPYVADWGTVKENLDTICGELLADHLAKKDAAKITRGKVAFFEGDWNGSYRYYPTKGRSVSDVIAFVKQKHPSARILNEMSPDEIVALIAA